MKFLMGYQMKYVLTQLKDTRIGLLIQAPNGIGYNE